MAKKISKKIKKHGFKKITPVPTLPKIFIFNIGKIGEKKVVKKFDKVQDTPSLLLSVMAVLAIDYSVNDMKQAKSYMSLSFIGDAGNGYGVTDYIYQPIGMKLTHPKLIDRFNSVYEQLELLSEEALNDYVVKYTQENTNAEVKTSVVQ